MALRSTYNTGVYDSGLFGVQETTQGAASASVSVSASVGVVTVVGASASADATFTSSSPSGVIIKDATASTGLNGIISAVAVKYEVVEGFRAGYGLNTYGTFMYGQNRSVEEASATANVSFTPSVAVQVTRNTSSTSDIVFSATAHAVYDIVGSANPTVSISTEISYNRVRLFSGETDILGDTVVSARYKWLDAPDPVTTWTTADYLERAA
jgi:hypothetical protein